MRPDSVSGASSLQSWSSGCTTSKLFVVSRERDLQLIQSLLGTTCDMLDTVISSHTDPCHLLA